MVWCYSVLCVPVVCIFSILDAVRIRKTAQRRKRRRYASCYHNYQLRVRPFISTHDRRGGGAEKRPPKPHVAVAPVEGQARDPIPTGTSRASPHLSGVGAGSGRPLQSIYMAGRRADRLGGPPSLHQFRLLVEFQPAAGLPLRILVRPAAGRGLVPSRAQRLFRHRLGRRRPLGSRCSEVGGRRP